VDFTLVSAIEIPGYKILKTLGVGGQATVYLAIQQGFDREVALKIMSPALAADPTFGERFIREAKIVAKLAHARIVTVYDVGESGSFYYLAMEYMRGEELKARISKGLRAKDALLIIAKLAQALHFAHKKGYIHRDVKSENILFDEDEQPVLTDFGIAKASNSSTQMTQTGKLIGTPEYMSPEQCRGKKLDGRSDLYSLGIILYEMLNRSVPFTGEDSVSVCIQHVTKPVPQLPARYKHLQWIIDSLLAKNPAERFQSGKELATAIKEFLTNGSTVVQTNRSNSKTKISQVIDKQPDSESQDFEDDSYEYEENYELSDNFEVEQRINVKPEVKSRLPLVITSFVLIIVGFIGYTKRYDWVPQAQQAIGVSWFELSEQGGLAVSSDNQKQSEKDVVEQQANGDNSLGEGAETKDKIEEISRVAQLIQQADTLAQYSPHQLTDIQQALDNLITAKSLEPNNDDVNRIKRNIVEIALAEAVSAADNNLFKSAQEWIDLVEFTDRENQKLAQTKTKVSQLLASHEQRKGDQEKLSERFEQLLLNIESSIDKGALSRPKGKNAIAYLTEAIEIDSDDERITSAKTSLESKYLELINKEKNGKKFKRALNHLGQLSKLSWNNKNYDALEKEILTKEQVHAAAIIEQQRLADIARLKQEADAQRSAKLADPLVQMKLQSNLESAQYLVQSNNLVEPIGNNALEKFKAALEIDTQNEIAIKGVAKIKSTIVSNLEVAISNNIKDSAEKWLAKLVVFDFESSSLDNYREQIEKIVEEPESIELDQNENIPQELGDNHKLSEGTINDKAAEISASDEPLNTTSSNGSENNKDSKDGQPKDPEEESKAKTEKKGDTKETGEGDS
jgi:serine/threonine protein kinase